MEKEEETANPVDPQFRSPSRGEYVEIYSGDGDSDDWREAVVMKTDKRCLRTYPDYYNVKYTDNGEKGSAKLDQDSLWRFADPQDQEFFWWRWGHLYEVE